MAPVVNAEQPARQENAIHAGAAQPDVRKDLIPAENLNIPLSTTPLFAQVVEHLADLDDYDDADTDALDEMVKTFMFGNILEQPVPGHWGESGTTVERLEWVMALLRDQ